MATTKQVAEFYGVDYQVVNKQIQINREELEKNGVKVMPHREIEALVYEDNMYLYKISKRGATVFTRRAILLVGMLLRDAKVVLEVGNQLLNFTENTSDEQKTFEITEEKELVMAIMFAKNEEET